MASVLFQSHLHSLPLVRDLLAGLFGFQVPAIPDWAREADPTLGTPWHEILPLLGWSAGGFASQVWYSYWVLGAGYGMAHERSWGMRADEERLARMTADEAREVHPVGVPGVTSLSRSITTEIAPLVASPVVKPDCV